MDINPDRVSSHIMAFSEFERKKAEIEAEAFLAKRRPPPEIRNELDLAYRIEGQSVVLYEIRPRWDNPREKMECMVAKTTYVRSQRVWKIFWQRADLKWHRYDPYPEAPDFQTFLDIVDQDGYACFFG